MSRDINGTWSTDPRNNFELHRWADERLPFIYHIDRVECHPFGYGNWHDSLEILLVTSGSGSILCDTARHSLSAGDIAVVDSNAVHTITAGDSIEYHCLIIGHSFCLENGFDIDRMHFRAVLRSEEIRRLMKNAIEEIEKASDGGRGADPIAVCAARGAVLCLLASLGRGFASQTEKRSDKTCSDTVKNGLMYINKNYTRHIVLDDIAAAAGASKYHFLRNFKLYTGYTVTEYVNMTRCEYARRLLLGAEKRSIGEVSRSCGFENLSYFSKTFKKYTGKLPSEIREQ